MQREWAALSQVGALSLYGVPYMPKAETHSIAMKPILLSYIHWRFVKHFPVLREAPQTYWRDRVQPFFDSLAGRSMSYTVERNEVTNRRLISMGLTRYFGT